MEGARGIERAAGGLGEGRIAELYSRHAPEAMRLAYLLTGDSHAAADVVQDAFIRLLGRFRDIRNPDAFEAYLRKTVVNLAKDRFRKLSSERARQERDRSLRREVAESMPDFSERDSLRRALRTLSYRQQAALVLRYFEDLSEGQTAEVLGCSVAAVKSLVARGTKVLRERLRGEIWM